MGFSWIELCQAGLYLGQAIAKDQATGQFDRVC